MHLAQLNIAESVHAMDDPRMEPFTGRINAINAMADRSEGFIWRLTDDDPNMDGALGLTLPGDDNSLVNMSVWDTLENLFAFVYKTAHAKIMNDNRDNFKTLATNHFVLWWIDEGHVPGLGEAAERLTYLRENGPSPHAFTFQCPFTASGEAVAPQFPKKDCA